MDKEEAKEDNNLLDNRTINATNRRAIISNLRQSQKTVHKQFAQDRLKRLQSNLKLLRDSKSYKEKDVPKRSTRSSTQSSSNSHNRMSITSTSNNVSSSKTTTAAFHTKRKANSTSAFTNIKQSSRSFLQSYCVSEKSKRLSYSDIKSAWAKPKALLDSSNRLQINPSISANERLSRLCESLQQRLRREPNNNHATASSLLELSNDDMEPMDIDGQDVQGNTNESTIEDNIPVKSDSSPRHNLPQGTTDSEDTIQELLATGQELPARCLDHIYFVLDTNVLIDSLQYVEDLCHMALDDSKGSMLYIPYIVIKELDKIKDKRNMDELKRKAAAKAISYLNMKFDNSLKIQGQSALEEANHLIDVDCPDDSIVNCCLQLQQEVPHVVLLTNDNNLRLKANASAIKVSRCSDLLKNYRKKSMSCQHNVGNIHGTGGDCVCDSCGSG